MGLISKYLGNDSTIMLATQRGKPLGIKRGARKTIERIDPIRLEEDYRFDGIAQSLVNKQVKAIMRAEFELQAKKASVRKFFEQFFEDLGSIGEEVTIEDIFEGLYNDQFIFGNAFLELIYEEGSLDREIVDLELKDAKRMDYAKDSKGNVALDDFNKPIGYIFKLPFGIGEKPMGDLVPEEHKGRVRIQANEIFMRPERIAHFKLNTTGDRLYGIGVLEPGHSSMFRKRKIEEANTNTIYTRGTGGTVVASVGDDRHEATPEHIENALETLSNLQHDRFAAFQHWVKLNVLDPGNPEDVQPTLDYLRLNQVSPSDVPEAIATGSGKDTNRSILTKQTEFLEISLEELAKKTARRFRKYVLKRIAKQNNITEVPFIKWGDIQVEEKNDRAARLLNAVNAGVLTPQEVKSYFMKAEGLKPNVKS